MSHGSILQTEHLQGKYSADAYAGTDLARGGEHDNVPSRIKIDLQTGTRFERIFSGLRKLFMLHFGREGNGWVECMVPPALRREVVFQWQRRRQPNEPVDQPLFRPIGEITLAQLMHVTRMTTDDDEAVDYCRKIIFDREDVTRGQSINKNFTMGQVQQLINDGVIQALSKLGLSKEDILQALSDKVRESQPLEIKSKECTDPEPAPAPAKPKTVNRREPVKQHDDEELWIARAAEFGEEPMRRRDGHVDGRWLARFKIAWQTRQNQAKA